MDTAIKYNAYDFIGNEFLTWLFMKCEKGEVDFQVEIKNKIVLSKKDGETITIKGDEFDTVTAKVAMTEGSIINELGFECFDEFYKCQYSFTLKGNDLCLSNLKTSINIASETSEELDAAILMKFYACQKPFSIIDGLFHEFMDIRLTKLWNDEVEKIIEWTNNGNRIN